MFICRILRNRVGVNGHSSAVVRPGGIRRSVGTRVIFLLYIVAPTIESSRNGAADAVIMSQLCVVDQSQLILRQALMLWTWLHHNSHQLVHAKRRKKGRLMFIDAESEPLYQIRISVVIGNSHMVSSI